MDIVCLRIFAVAINTVMFGTDSARHPDLFTHRVTSTMDTNSSIPFSNARACGEVGETAFAEVNRNERFSYSGFKFSRSGWMH